MCNFQNQKYYLARSICIMCYNRGDVDFQSREVLVCVSKKLGVLCRQPLWFYHSELVHVLQWKWCVLSEPEVLVYVLYWRWCVLSEPEILVDV